MKTKEKSNIVAKKETVQESLYSVQKVVVSLGSIFEEMDKICADTDTKNSFQNKNRMDLLSKNASIKMEYIKTAATIKQLENEERAREPQPIEVKFVSPNTNEEQERIARLQEEVDISMGKGGKA